jgi:hypothetical protein
MLIVVSLAFTSSRRSPSRRSGDRRRVTRLHIVASHGDRRAVRPRFGLRLRRDSGAAVRGGPRDPRALCFDISGGCAARPRSRRPVFAIAPVWAAHIGSRSCGAAELRRAWAAEPRRAWCEHTRARGRQVLMNSEHARRGRTRVARTNLAGGAPGRRTLDQEAPACSTTTKCSPPTPKVRGEQRTDHTGAWGSRGPPRTAAPESRRRRSPKRGRTDRRHSSDATT